METWPLSRHVVAFARRQEGQLVVIVAARLFVELSHGDPDEAIPELPRASAWSGTTVRFPAVSHAVVLENILTGEFFSTDDGSIRLTEAFRHIAWAALVAGDRRS